MPRAGREGQQLRVEALVARREMQGRGEVFGDEAYAELLGRHGGGREAVEGRARGNGGAKAGGEHDCGSSHVLERRMRGSETAGDVGEKLGAMASCLC